MSCGQRTAPLPCTRVFGSSAWDRSNRSESPAVMTSPCAATIRTAGSLSCAESRSITTRIGSSLGVETRTVASSACTSEARYTRISPSSVTAISACAGSAPRAEIGTFTGRSSIGTSTRIVPVRSVTSCSSTRGGGPPGPRPLRKISW